MKRFQKTLALLLCVVLLVPLFAAIPANAADDAAQTGADYPTVFVHGLGGWGSYDDVNDLIPYWGMTAGNMLEYLEGKGYEVYAASVGPASSAWDRCCELFAQLTGTRVDYGAAHAAAYTEQLADRGYSSMSHARYGRSYAGKQLLTGWGPIYDENGSVTGWYDSKINLVGHSFGGPTIVEFLHLLAEGDADEQAWGKEQAALYGGDWHDYISPLFWGDYDGEYLVNSLTSLAGVLNGTTYLSTERDFTALASAGAMAIGNVLGNSDFSTMYDFQLEQFGITKAPGEDIDSQIDVMRQKGFLACDDQAFYDLSIAGCNELKLGWETYDNVYYFSYTGDKTHENLLGNYVPDADMWAPFLEFSTEIGSYTNRYEFVNDIYGNRACSIDDSWKPNDGMVNTISARYPIGAAHTDYNSANIEPGVWNVHADMDVDHMYFCGSMLNSKPVATRLFFRGLMEDITASTPVAKPASTDPTPTPTPTPTPDPTPAVTNPFTDVAEGRYYYDAVLWAVNHDPQITEGTTATTFSPNEGCTRAQMVTFLWRAAGCPETGSTSTPFTDVNPDAYYYNALLWATAQGIVEGTSATTFSPNERVTRAQAVTFLWRADGRPAVMGTTAFTDLNPDAYYYDAVLWAENHDPQIVYGKTATSFAPGDTCTRGEIVTFLYRAMGE